MIVFLVILALSTAACAHSSVEAERAFLKYAELSGPRNAKYEVDVRQEHCEYIGIVWYLPHTPDMNIIMKMDTQGRIYAHGRGGWKPVESHE